MKKLLEARAKRSGKHWTPQEDEKLRLFWHDYSIDRIYKELPGRTLVSLRLRARKIGLGLGIPNGHVSIRAAASKLGVADSFVKKLCKRSGIPIHRTHPSTHIKHRKLYRLYVEWDAVREAFEKHAKLWTVRQMADKLGVPRLGMFDWMKYRKLQKKSKHGKRPLYTEKEAQKLMADYAEHLRTRKPRKQRSAFERWINRPCVKDKTS